MRQLELKNGGFTLVDDEDYERLSQFSWLKGARGYIIRYVGRTTVWMHREVMGVQKGDKRDVDHINRDRTDNRQSNLRICTRSENCRNTGKKPSNTSGYKGVSWHKKYKCWQVKIKVSYKTIWIGRFHDVLEAATAYEEAAKKYHGEFACLDR